ncbi:MAG: FecR domain-containing protein [Candidatus Dojkabacteria bacterium]
MNGTSEQQEGSNEPESRAGLLILVVVLLAAAVGLAVWIISASSPASDESTTADGDVTFTEGDLATVTPTPEVKVAILNIASPEVTVVRDGEEIEINTNQVEIREGDRVRTDDSATGYIVFEDSSVITLDKNTDIEISAYDENADGNLLINIEQFLGRTWSSVQSLFGSADYSIETSNTVASVRGTEFGCEVTVLGVTTCYVGEDDITLTLKNLPESFNEIILTADEEFENDSDVLTDIASATELIALIEEHIDEDQDWQDYVECVAGTQQLNCAEVLDFVDSVSPTTTPTPTPTTTTSPTPVVTPMATPSATPTPTPSPTPTPDPQDLAYILTSTIGGTDNDHAFEVTTDIAGNVFMTGSFRGQNVDFERTISGTAGIAQPDLHSSNGGDDVFLTKFNADGSYAWTRTFGSSTGDDQSFAVATDGFGDVYITGHFFGSVDFDQGGVGGAIFNSNGDADVFIAKFLNDGNFAWVKAFGSYIYPDFANDITITSSDKIFVTGAILDGSTGVDFDPFGQADVHISNGGKDAFITGVNLNGSYLWTATFGNTLDDEGFGINADNTGVITTTGVFHGSVDFNHDPELTDMHFAVGAGDAFVTQSFDDGLYMGTKTFGGNGEDAGRAVTSDYIGNLFVTGHYEDTVNFAAPEGSEIHVSNGLEDIFITSLDSGLLHRWTRVFGSTGSDIGNDISSDRISSVYTTGYFNGTVEFGSAGGAITDPHSSEGIANVFVTKLNDTNGSYVVTRSFGGDDAHGEGIHVVDSDLFVVGDFKGTNVDFDDTEGFDHHTTNGGSDIFLTSYFNELN